MIEGAGITSIKEVIFKHRYFLAYIVVHLPSGNINQYYSGVSLGLESQDMREQESNKVRFSFTPLLLLW